jgi:hypothetical protein
LLEDADATREEGDGEEQPSNGHTLDEDVSLEQPDSENESELHRELARLEEADFDFSAEDIHVFEELDEELREWMGSDLSEQDGEEISLNETGAELEDLIGSAADLSSILVFPSTNSLDDLNLPGLAASKKRSRVESDADLCAPSNQNEGHLFGPEDGFPFKRSKMEATGELEQVESEESQNDSLFDLANDLEAELDSDNASELPL